MLNIITQNPYLSLLVTTTIEGPIATFISAGLAAHQILNLQYVVIITIIGDVLGDIGLYLIGRYLYSWGIVHRFIHLLDNKKSLRTSFNKKPLLYMIISKLTPYLATPTLIFAGFHRMKITTYLGGSLLISILVKAIYITLGYLGAVSVQQVTQFLTGWSRIAGYIILGLLGLWCTTILYRYIATVIIQKFKS